MKRLVSAFLSAIALSSSVSAQQIDTSASDTWVAGVFKSLCFEPFDDLSKVQSAVAAYSAMEFRRIETDPASPQIGTTWEAPKASLRYTNSTLLPRDLPSPQCTLMAQAGSEFDHSETVAALQSTLPIGDGKTKGKKGRYRTEWNFQGPNGAKRRLFLSSNPAGYGFQATVSLLNLRK